MDAAFLIAEKPSKLGARKSEHALRRERQKSCLRAKVEHPFRVVKRQFGYVMVRYRGLAKSAAQIDTLFALSDLWMVRKRLLPVMG